jgi:hypothetical protein
VAVAAALRRHRRTMRVAPVAPDAGRARVAPRD